MYINPGIMDFHTLYTLPYDLPYARIGHETPTQASQEMYFNMQAQKYESRNYLENSGNDYYTFHLFYSYQSASEHVLALMCYRALVKVNAYLYSLHFP